MSQLRKASLFQDLSGVLRGLYVVKQNANMIVSQRPLPGAALRTLTDAQRESYTHAQEALEFERQQEMEEKEQVQKMMAAA
jgi:hypothetical protein